MTDTEHPLHVVVIDDDPDDLFIIGDALKRIPNLKIEIKPFSEPDAGLAELKETGADLIVLDFSIGARTGPEVFRDIRDAGCEAPVILVTDKGDESLAAASIRMGFSDYIPKQVLSPDSLGRAISNAREKWALRKDVSEHQQMLEKTVADLKSRNHEISEFYHTLSHELKTPLTACREFISIVLDGLQGEINADQRGSLEVAHRNCGRMRVMINDLLDASRLETGKLSAQLSKESMTILLGRAMQNCKSTASKKGVSVECRVADDLPEATVDGQRLLQVLDNLIDNAVKFTEPGGSVQIGAKICAADAERIELWVKDTGRGIEPDRLDYIFERLYQSSEGDSVLHGGLGLGLNICRELVRLHGGDIRVESALGAGSTFSFDVPVSQPDHATREARLAS